MIEAVLAASRDSSTSGAISEAARRLELPSLLFESGRDLIDEAMRREIVPLVVIDLDPSPVVALELCRRLHSDIDAPLIAIGDSGEKEILIRALRAGADHYVGKPVDPEVLAAYFDATIYRRRSARAGSGAVTIRDLTVDADRKEILLKGEAVPVTRAEYRLLACLARNLGRVTSCSELVREIGGYECSEQEAQQIVKVHVSRLRAKIDRDPSIASYVANVRGFGYLLERRSPVGSGEA